MSDLTKLTKAQLIALATSLAAQVAPVATATARTFATKAERAAGDGFPCAVPGTPCSRTDLRTTKRAAIHGVEQGGHVAR